jgi:hypothetical protein
MIQFTHIQFKSKEINLTIIVQDQLAGTLEIYQRTHKKVSNLRAIHYSSMDYGTRGLINTVGNLHQCNSHGKLIF